MQENKVFKSMSSQDEHSNFKRIVDRKEKQTRNFIEKNKTLSSTDKNIKKGEVWITQEDNVVKISTRLKNGKIYSTLDLNENP